MDDVDQFVLGALQEVKLGHYEAVYPRLRDQKDPFRNKGGISPQMEIMTRVKRVKSESRLDHQFWEFVLIRIAQYCHF